MKKYLFQALLLSLAIVMLVGCATPATLQPTAVPTVAASATPEKPVTLKMIIWNNPPTVDILTKINDEFHTKYPNITVDMSVETTADYWTVMPTRLSAADLDILLLQGFPSQVKDYMKGVEKPSWQNMVEGGQLMDLTGQSFLKNYDQTYLMTWGSFQNKVYTISGGSYAFTGVFYNKDLFAKYKVAVPTTWDEFVKACGTFKANNVDCMTTGAKDVWPLMVAGWGVQQAIYPDTEKALQGFWTGTVKFNDAQAITAWTRMQQLLTFFEPGVAGIDNTSAPGRFATGNIAMYPAGTWDAPSIEKANPTMNYGYFPMPGSDNAADNKSMGVKSDSSFSIAGNSPNKEAALKWLDFFSQTSIYSEYVNAVGVLPSQPDATLTTKMGKEIAPYLPNLTAHLSVVWVSPKGVGANASAPFLASLFKPYGTFDDPKALADAAQADWEAGVNASK